MEGAHWEQSSTRVVDGAYLKLTRSMGSNQSVTLWEPTVLKLWQKSFMNAPTQAEQIMSTTWVHVSNNCNEVNQVHLSMHLCHFASYQQTIANMQIHLQMFLHWKFDQHTDSWPAYQNFRAPVKA